MLKPLIVANWKMNYGITETAEFIKFLKNAELPQDREIIICPPFTVLHLFGAVPHGGQDLHWEKSGAFTGEVSADMLKELGCIYVIIGHSERRQYFGETDKTVVKKVDAALTAGLTPIVCVRSVEEVTPALVGKPIVIAYEPVWAIGTGNAATPEHAQDIHSQIRKLVGDQVRILYGGSVNETNAAGYLAQPDVNGLLVGGASLDANTFLKIINVPR